MTTNKTKVKAAKDPMVHIKPLEDVLLTYPLLGLMDDSEDVVFIENEEPKWGCFYKFTSDKIIIVSNDVKSTNFGTKRIVKTTDITIAYRDGQTEYDLIKEEIESYKQARKARRKHFDDIDSAIKYLSIMLNKLPPFNVQSTVATPKKFEDFLINTQYKTSITSLKNNFVVFDVETNGTRPSHDDLLSLSIYDPTTGVCYNRYFPLDLQPVVLTGWINGITGQTLEAATHMTQSEFNEIVEYFHLNNRVFLSYSGGAFDFKFVNNYLKRHNIQGFENLKFEDIKTLYKNLGFGREAALSKDNLCRALKIEGVTKIHSGINDCILEWKLFEKVKTEKLISLGGCLLYKYHPGYIVPVSYIDYGRLAKFAGIEELDFEWQPHEVFRYSLPKRIIQYIRKFPTNITGETLEHGINYNLNAEEQNNYEFLLKNKLHLEYLGAVESTLTEIQVIKNNDGTFSAINNEDKEYVEEVNEVTRIITENMADVFDFIKNSLFANEKILSQELSISTDGKVLAKCDLSSKTKVLEIKTYPIFSGNDNRDFCLVRQLYYESRMRETYALSIDFQQQPNKYGQLSIKAIEIIIYKVDIKPIKPEPYIKELDEYEILMIKLMLKNPSITRSQLCVELSLPLNEIKNIITELKDFGYIDSKHDFHTPWKILRSYEDNLTKYTFDGDEIKIITE